MFKPETPASDSLPALTPRGPGFCGGAFSAASVHATHLLVEFKNLGIGLMATISG